MLGTTTLDRGVLVPAVVGAARALGSTGTWIDRGGDGRMLADEPGTVPLQVRPSKLAGSGLFPTAPVRIALALTSLLAAAQYR